MQRGWITETVLMRTWNGLAIVGKSHLYILDYAAFAFGDISDERIAKASVMGEGRNEQEVSILQDA